ncbi:MAG: DUF6340 family protein [Candidatus Saccharibacteria bacterium]
MKYNRSLWLLLLLAFTSCLSAFKMNSIRVEMMKPSLLPYPEKINTIALFSRDLVHLDTTEYSYFNSNSSIKDSSFHIIDNYNACINALTQTIVDARYFNRVINCEDHFNESIRTSDTSMYTELFHFLNADALVFLDRYKLNDFQWKKGDDGAKEVKDMFSEFGKCSELAQNWASLTWRVRIKGDTANYIYRQLQDLYYGDSIYPQFFGSKEKHRLMLDNTSTFFAKQFAGKLLPSWQQEERLIYAPADTAMQKAARYCQNGEWMKAAEIYKRLTQSEKRTIAICATFNMAFICEMEGDLDAAIDWLTKSKEYDNYMNADNCMYYLEILKTRKKELKILDQQLKDKRQFTGI